MLREIVTEANRYKASSQAKKLIGKTETQPCRIQNETCPAPECNLSKKDVEKPLNELKKYMKLFKPAFQRVEQMTVRFWMIINPRLTNEAYSVTRI